MIILYIVFRVYLKRVTNLKEVYEDYSFVWNVE